MGRLIWARVTNGVQISKHRFISHSCHLSMVLAWYWTACLHSKFSTDRTAYLGCSGHYDRGKKKARVFKLLPDMTHAVSAHISLAKANYIVKSNFSRARRYTPPPVKGSVCWYNYHLVNLHAFMHINQEIEKVELLFLFIHRSTVVIIREMIT